LSNILLQMFRSLSGTTMRTQDKIGWERMECFERNCYFWVSRVVKIKTTLFYIKCSWSRWICNM
jgi:hypothetical protein